MFQVNVKVCIVEHLDKMLKAAPVSSTVFPLCIAPLILTLLHTSFCIFDNKTRQCNGEVRCCCFVTRLSALATCEKLTSSPNTSLEPKLKDWRWENVFCVGWGSTAKYWPSIKVFHFYRTQWDSPSQKVRAIKFSGLCASLWIQKEGNRQPSYYDALYAFVGKYKLKASSMWCNTELDMGNIEVYNTGSAVTLFSKWSTWNLWPEIRTTADDNSWQEREQM